MIASDLKKQWRRSLWLALLCGIILPLAIFGVVAWRVWGLQGGFGWDVAILKAIHATASPRLTWFATVFTQFGSAWKLLPVTVAIAVLLTRRQQWRSLLYLVVTLVGCGFINLYAKIFWHRVRPQPWDTTYPVLTDFSFPSGHAMSSMATTAVLIVLTWNTCWRRLVVSLGSLYVLGIGWTRLYLDVHYPSDVLAGWMVAIAWVISMNLLIKPLDKPFASPIEPPQPPEP